MESENRKNEQTKRKKYEENSSFHVAYDKLYRKRETVAFLQDRLNTKVNAKVHFLRTENIVDGIMLSPFFHLRVYRTCEIWILVRYAWAVN